MNKLDQSIKLLKEHKANLEHERRDIDRALAKLDRIISMLGTNTSNNRPRSPHGPIRRDSHIIMRDAIKTAFAPGHTFTRAQAKALVDRDILREGQASGAIDTLVEMGWLTRAAYNQYHYEK